MTVCKDCKGTGVYEPLVGPAEACRRCGGSKDFQEPGDLSWNDPASTPLADIQKAKRLMERRLREDEPEDVFYIDSYERSKQRFADSVDEMSRRFAARAAALGPQTDGWGPWRQTYRELGIDGSTHETWRRTRQIVHHGISYDEHEVQHVDY